MKIREKTTFVIGAGASAPYGFPLGAALKTKIITSSGYSNSRASLKQLGIDDQHRNDYVDILKHGPYCTIDEFLDKRKRFRKIGNLTIASSLLPLEKKETLFLKPDWYFALFQKLKLGENAQSEATVKFITLNYERSLEYFLDRAILLYLTDNQEQAAHDELGGIEIIHAHGSFGTLSEIPYGSGASPDSSLLSRTAANIAIVSDRLDDSPDFQAAKRALDWAERVIFIGLGYHPITMNALFDGIARDGKSFLGTSRGLSAERNSQVYDFFGGGISMKDADALKFVEELEL